MCLDGFPLAAEGEVASVVLALVQLAHARGEVGGGKAHPVVESDENLTKKIVYSENLPVCCLLQFSANLNSHSLEGGPTGVLGRSQNTDSLLSSIRIR